MRTRSVVVVFGSLTALFASGYGVMFTVLDEFRDQYGISEGALGLIVAMGFLSSFVAQVTIAPLADRGHARLMIVIGMVLNVAGLLGMAFGKTVLVLLTARFVMGSGVGLAYPASRRIVILAEPDRLGQNLGRLLAADVGGFAMGPAISAILVGPFGIAAPFLLIAVLTVALYPLIARTHVEETIVAEEERPPRFAFDDVQYFAQRTAPCFRLTPASEILRDRVEEPHASRVISRNDAIADAAQRGDEPLLAFDGLFPIHVQPPGAPHDEPNERQYDERSADGERQQHHAHGGEDARAIEPHEHAPAKPGKLPVPAGLGISGDYWHGALRMHLFNPAHALLHERDR